MPSLAYTTYLENIPALIKAYPRVFNRKKPLPLKVGIYKDLCEAQEIHGLTPDTLTHVLAIWVIRREYHEAMCLHSHRFDLQCNVVSKVTDGHKGHHAYKLARSHIKAWNIVRHQTVRIQQLNSKLEAHNG